MQGGEIQQGRPEETIGVNQSYTRNGFVANAFIFKSHTEKTLLWRSHPFDRWSTPCNYPASLTPLSHRGSWLNDKRRRIGMEPTTPHYPELFSDLLCGHPGCGDYEHDLQLPPDDDAEAVPVVPPTALQPSAAPTALMIRLRFSSEST